MRRGVITFLNAPCRHCAALKNEHADDVQCLFRSSTYEPEPREQLQKVAAVCIFPGSIYTPGFLEFKAPGADWATGRYWLCATWRIGGISEVFEYLVLTDSMEKV